MTFHTTMKPAAIAALLGSSLLAGPALAQDDYPSRSVEVVHQYGPGGGTDRFIRAVAQPFEEITGESMVSISVQGGGGIPAVVNFTQRPADGHSLMAISPAQIIAHVQDRIDMADFMPLARVQYDQALIWVPADSEFETIDQFVQHAKDNPGELKIALSGAAGFDEITVGLFGLEAEADFGTVPFSSSEMVSNTLGGQVDAMFEEYGPARGLYDSGDMRPLVVFSEERLPVLEDVPTATEKGWDVTLGRWRAFAMQAEDTEEHAEALYADIEEAVATESYKKFEEQNALQYRSELLGPDEFQTFIEGEIETYTTVLRELGYIE